jgi:excisionase family DNA binding protein
VAIRNWAGERGLPYIKIGNRKRFKPEDVEKWLGKLREKGIIE